MNVFAGIDLAIAKKKRLPICLCKLDAGRLVPFPLSELGRLPPRGRGNIAAINNCITDEFVEEAANYLHYLEDYFNVAINRIAIDAPRSPRKENIPRRLAEVALDRQKISCFTTPSAAEFEAKRQKIQAHIDAGGTASTLPAANQLWMLVGFALFTRLEKQWECLEVYPQATMHIIGAAKVHKTKKEGLAAQIQAVAKYTGWDELIRTPYKALKNAVCGPSHDALDAYSSAWVASLEPNEREAYGTPPNDAIWVPIPSKPRKIERL